MTGSADHLLALVKLGTKVNMPERCRVLAEAKAAYLKLHPETGRGKAGGYARQGKLKAPGFGRYASGLTGRSCRSIEGDISIWERLAPDSRARLSGAVHSDKQRTLAALAAEPPERQRLALDRLLSGEAGTVEQSLQATGRLSPRLDLSCISSRDLLTELWRRETRRARQRYDQ